MLRLQPTGILCAVLLVVLAPTVSLACLWDYDTLLAERSRFPSVLEIITGKFLRHSNEFYEWRVKDRLQKLERDPENLEWLDDLAVAYDKLGRQDEAIALMERKEQLQPGLYETAANHGTFLGHAGRLEDALPYLKRAVEINPNAHFGREKYQIHLYEHALAKSEAGFGEYLAERSGGELTQLERQAAIKGVLGIMRFGNQDNPKVLQALASLLAPGHGESPHMDGKALAARACLKASYMTKGSEQAAMLREAAASTIEMQTSVDSLASLEAEFKQELADANRWYDDLRQRELAWIAAGVDVDAEFAKLYQQEPRAIESRWESNRDHGQSQTVILWRLLLIGAGALIFLAFAGVGGLYFAYRLLTRISQPTSQLKQPS